MKIPPTATRVFKGVIFDVYQWQQKLFDGSSATFEALKRPNTVQVIATRNGKKGGKKNRKQSGEVCILHEQQPTKGPFYGLPGGRQEEGETSLECAKRELLEETGLASRDWELLKTYEPIHKMEWAVYVFLAKQCKAVANQKLDAGENIKVTWVSFDTFMNRITGSKFWGRELTSDVLRIQGKKGELVRFKKKLFGK